MADENRPDVLVDLFGDALTLPSGRRGRPSHRWSKSNADRVLLGLALGYSDPEIAQGIGVSTPTLRKHYFSELKRRDMQRVRLEFWRVHKLAEQGERGNVGALKELGKIMEGRERSLAARRLRDEDQDDDTPILPEGKKAQREAQAREALRSDPLLRPNGLH